MENRITQALSKLFERHRIVFWYDAKQELYEEFEKIVIPGVEKIELANNEFGVKYCILRKQPTTQFLLYHRGVKPEDLNNWLLDVQLAHAEFSTDQVAIWLSELELGFECVAIAERHMAFFRAVKRKETLKGFLKPGDTQVTILLKMLATCTGSEPRIDHVLEDLLAEYAIGRDEKFQLLSSCKLDDFLWEQLKRSYGYASESPGIQDFVMELFKSCYAMGTDGQVSLAGDALVFLRRWKDSRQYESVFEKLSSQCAQLLNIEHDLVKRDFRQLMDVDYFRLIDQKIVSELVRGVLNRTVAVAELATWIRQRRQGRWYHEFQHLYEAVDYAAQFIHALEEAELTMTSLGDGIQRYTLGWFRLDQLYRKFIYRVQSSGQVSLMESLFEHVEKLYSNNYLLKMNDRWQSFIDEVAIWKDIRLPLQQNFFEGYVRPVLIKNKKIYVIISDALRYEIGEELVSHIRQVDRIEAVIKPLLTMLPSYTQLGMAALLPHNELTLADNESGIVFVDGQNSQGIVNRNKILKKGTAKQAVAIKSENLLGMKSDECQALVREHDVVYIYHNCIDVIGDKRETEERVFTAVEETMQELLRMVKKLTSASATNILITADHGFIYQHKNIADSDFSGIDVEGEKILFRDRRFVLGRGLKESVGFRKFHSFELGLSGDVEVQLPKSINRLRLKGSGSRFVHGGASLQEVVIPVIQIKKKNQSDTAIVDVDILRGSSSIITSGQLVVAFYQTQAVTDKIQPVYVRAGIYTQTGELISDCHNLTFDIISDNPREREVQVRFTFARQSDEVNGQEVILKLEQNIKGTSHYTEYKSLRYQLRRSFTSDFD